MDRFEIIKGDITQKKADAIVCGSDYSLLSGGAVFDAIHKISGKELTEDCKKIKGCPIGKAKITEAYELPAKKVIHTAIPMWENGENNINLNLLHANSAVTPQIIQINGTTHYDFAMTYMYSPALKWVGYSGDIDSQRLIDILKQSITGFFNDKLKSSGDFEINPTQFPELMDIYK